MSDILLIALLIVSVVGALFTTIVVLGVGSMCQKAQEDIRGIKKDLEEFQKEIANSHDFDAAVTDCINGIGQALDIINERTNWLDDVEDQISNAFNQNKNGKES